MFYIKIAIENTSYSSFALPSCFMSIQVLRICYIFSNMYQFCNDSCFFVSKNNSRIKHTKRKQAENAYCKFKIQYEASEGDLDATYLPPPLLTLVGICSLFSFNKKLSWVMEAFFTYLSNNASSVLNDIDTHLQR